MLVNIFPREDMVDQGYTTFGYMKMQMVVAHGGRCAERVVFGDDVTDGGRDDLEKITKYIEETEELAMNALLQYIEETEELAMNALKENRHILDIIVKELLEKLRIIGLEVEEKLKGLSPVMFEDYVKPFQINLQETCKELGMKRPTAVQSHCIPKILEGRDVLGLAQTGSGKTAAFALPILQRLAEDPYGVLVLVVTPTRELAEQFRALGSCLHLRCEVLLEEDPDIPPVFSKTKFLVLDEADRVLDAGFEDELRVVFQCLPKSRQTLLFSATMTSDLQTLLELSSNKAYFYEAYEGLKTVDTLKQKFIKMPKKVKDVYLVYMLSKMEDMGIRSAIIFVSTCRNCHRLSLLLEELDQKAAALHSFKSQSLRLSSLHRFKSGQASILLATDVAGRGLDIPTVDLVINYDIPMNPRDCSSCGAYCKSRQGWAVCELRFPSKNDVVLLHAIEADLGKQLEEFECKEQDVLSDIMRVRSFGIQFWDNPHVIPANMTLELSELFSRELTRTNSI
ncbi:hypothetical protein EZV62_006262 [Acer yangbiense]|uniref:RNA helicase n=1 Tax=Acer yangbiense TaxID=1000413 RepID=A0A5C7IPL2_9ROSI|nr:hypothetical protein EZV62_006262 [Acer yangbiense]